MVVKNTAAKTNGESQTPKMEVKKNEPSKVENSILSLEKRIQKVEELNIVIDKWRKLNEAKKNLNGFKLGADGLSSTVVIRDVSGQEFKTSHNIVVETVLTTVQGVLDEKITEVEEQINFAA
jgi:ribosomal protein S30